MSEADFQQRITDLCDWLHLRWHHETDSRRSRAGFPDLVIVGYRTIWVELKSDKGKLSFDQRGWLDDLRESGQEVYLWRPQDWEGARKVLFDLAGRNI